MRMPLSLLTVAMSTVISIPVVQAKIVGTLENINTSATITIDGVVDDAWSKAPVLKVNIDKTPYKPNNGYKGVLKSDYTIKSMRKGGDIYFLVQWTDSTESLNRFPWIKQPDGSWKQLANKDDTGHDNTYYEDKMAILWNIDLKAFKKKGCAAACHLSKNGKTNGLLDKAPGRKYTKNGTTIDM
jgi:hypothetical protein